MKFKILLILSVLLLPCILLAIPDHVIPVPENSGETNNSQRVPEEVHFIDELKRLICERDNKRFVKMVKNIVKNPKIRRKIPTMWPVLGGGVITSPFGPRYTPFSRNKEFHPGIDIAMGPGTPLIATADGIVTNSETSSGYGILVVVKHAYGFSTFYGHLMRSKVVNGDVVRRGDIIGYMGNTGRSGGVHVHYEVRINDRAVNPRYFMFIKSF